MNVSVQLNDNIVQQIENLVKERLEDAVNQVIAENLDEIVLGAVKTQMKSAALLYIQSPELRRKMHEKVKPAVDALIGEN